MESRKLAEVLDYMHTDQDDDRAKRIVKSAVDYLYNAGIEDDGSEAYMTSVKALSLSLYDNVHIQKEGNRFINQLELINEVNRFGL